ncbi:signal peptide peptidase SppA [Pleionea sediminis]|uniref:signal peptide peptidase SppA n=1 Tax=Pleionea sediminis TaxID=2569479 RepID=UPI0011858232|nr:signal peptide peptidase SppA [Pleionea sediminis]
MEKPSSTVGKIFYYIWRAFELNRRILFGFIALFLSIYILIDIFSDGDKIEVPDGAALVFAPSGIITEQTAFVDPVEEALNDAMNNSSPAEENIYDLIEVLRNAKEDDRITTLLLYPEGIISIQPAMMEMLRDAIADFKESGKKVVAMGDFYSQAQYHIAAQADEVYLHPFGGVLLEGYSRVRTYFAELLDNLKVTPNVFKVGKYKSAIEPFLRNDMSDYAKEANRAFLADLWNAYKGDVAKFRNLDVDQMDEQINQFDKTIREVGGDFAQVAIKHGLVDELKTRPEFREMMIERVGKDEKELTFKQIHHRRYHKAIKPAFEIMNPTSKKIAVVVAKGEIVDGNAKEGVIGGDTIARKIRRARLNENTAAIVLRVDSPGGSAFASEIIRQELLKAKEQGLPVIASMGSYAASGGYWISANADEIWARPTTVTGSIGIFGFIPTFEKSLAWAGVHRDGVGTTKLAGAMDVGQGLKEPVKEIIQANIEKGYDRFLEIVAEGRNMTKEDVDKIAQGRVWSGTKAKELGLVDNIGTYKDAIEAAAKRAELEKDQYDVWYVKRELSDKEKFIKQLLGEASANFSVEEMNSQLNKSTPAFKLMEDMKAQFKTLERFNDPHHAYIHCNCVVE